MNKKAASIVMMIFELLVVVLVLSIVFSIVKEMASGERTEKKILAEEIRMMIDTLVGVPGGAVVEYPYNVSEYSFLLDKGSIAVFKEGEDKVNWAIRNFYLPEGYDAVGILDEEERLCLEKKERSILLRECKIDEK
jgi:hypothetical protein